MSQEPDELESSLKSPLGQLRSGLRCKQHPDRILAGRHRFKHLNQQGKQARFQEYDCEELAKKLDVSHEVAHWVVTYTDNIQRQVGEEERRQELLHIAIELEKLGIPTEKRVQKISQLLGLSERRIQQLLPSEHKRAYNSETISQLGEEITKKVSDNQRFSEDASKHRISTYTQAEQLFSNHLSYFNLEYRTQEVFVRAAEFTNGGIQKTYTADFYLPKANLVIELMGEGSSSDKAARHQFFKEKGIKEWDIPNDMAIKYGAQIAELIAVLTK